MLQLRRFFFPALLVAPCLLVYAQVWHFQFVNFDDEDYIYANPHVLQGLHWETVRWAFTTGWASNYHPLTWISLALDISCFGLTPGWFHLENVILHVLNALLLLRFVRRLTADPSIAFFVAFVFALHPTHVESVAWVTERKDVLSTFFLLLCILAYLRYTQDGLRRDYAAAVIWFALSLLAKQMGVTLPVILLLLDYWPLRRFHLGIWHLVREKLPLLLLSAVACVATFIAQHHSGAVATLKGLPISYRVQSVPIAYAIYLRQTFWPEGLCAFYPYRSSYLISAVIESILLLMLITAVCWWQRRRRPYLLVGWVWFVVMLTPVIGLVQIGSALTADRYLYMPSVGLTLSIAVLVKQWVADLGSLLTRRLTAMAAVLIAIALAALSYQQVGYWENTRTLFTRALTLINQGSYVHMQLARLYVTEHDLPAARREYAIAARISPEDFEPEYDLGNLSLDDPPTAIAHYQRALQLQPGDAKVENNLAIAYLRAGRAEEAIAAFQSAIEDDPNYLDAELNLAKLLESRQMPEQARRHYQAALQLDPGNVTAQAGLARVR